MSEPKDKKNPPRKPSASLRDMLIDDDLTRRVSEALGKINPVDISSITSSDAIRPWRHLDSDFLSKNDAVLDRFRFLDEEITPLRQKLNETVRALQAEKANSLESNKKVAELESIITELRQKEQLGFLLSRVNETAQSALLRSEDFRKQFTENSECVVYVMSIDIRRSTELMLKARRPEDFASFITTLCNSLQDIVRASYGVVDKFTGDGILAFFPEFYSGPDAGYYVLRAAHSCHLAFEQHYRASRKYFTSILTNVGLGIGIDYGTARLIQVAGGLTVVGTPVVYACRLSGVSARSTFLNQPAYEQISARFSANYFIEETEVEIKHEGNILAYMVRPTAEEVIPALPSWASTNSVDKPNPS